MNYPKSVVVGDITVRDGYQHEEKFIPTEAKVWMLEQLLLAGFQHLEVTNFDNPKGMPQFSDADDVEHADHDGSVSPDRVYRYYSMLQEKVGNTSKQIVHLRTTRGWGMANVLAALQAGMTHYELIIGGIGVQPANFVDGVPVAGTGSYYYKDPNLVGLVSTEDMVVMIDEMGIETNLDIDKVLKIGEMNERIVGRRLRSESIKNGRISKTLTVDNYFLYRQRNSNIVSKRQWLK